MISARSRHAAAEDYQGLSLYLSASDRVVVGAMGMSRTLNLAILAALSTMSSACGRNANPEPNATEAPATAGNVINRIEALSDGQRNGVFIRAIRDAGLDCQHVDSSTRSGTYEGMPVWTAACSRNQVWIIVVRADGTAQVLNPTEGLLIYNRMDGNGR